MPNSPVVPTIRRRRLGSTLRRLRNDAGLTLDDAAAAMGWKGPKMSKVENAAAGIRPAQVTDLLKAYGVTDPEVFAALENLAKDAGKRGWWQTYSGVVTSAYADYIALESDAEKVCEWSPLLVPGLLQTAAYAREVIGGITLDRAPEEITALAEVRQARQAVLSRPGHPLEVWAIIHVAALHQRFAIRPATMREQLRRLLDVAELPNVTVQVMPLDATVHPGTVGAFTLVGFPGPTPDVVSLENLRGATYLEGDEDTAPFAKAFERIRAAALSVEDSLALIADLEEGHRK
ncbi:helix-turn-helix domain-containing protein [Streptomyces flavofungini]|uniref:helix-turn-helix domain-containing protein n=1 Tax=Streptomyces flavofungini TaxID=68200 RepID=UPI0025AF41FE|nr:helix-turn-helix transcriptional regulator [Streptomyces flavofungini]WJV51734.1 helix-turn-helix transcriptional regulator [Streptomyces flavofungini]